MRFFRMLMEVAAAGGLLVAPIAASAQDAWAGYNVLRGGKGYAVTPMGQVHYRDVGPRDAKVTVLLLHMTPMSMIQYADVQPELARKGIRSIAVDTPGYGLSDLPTKAHPEIAEFADNLVPVLDQLHIRKVVVAGHHTGASIATSFAVRHPDRVSAIVLHGTPIFDAAELAKRRAASSIDRTLRQDGTHLSRFFHPPPAGAPPTDQNHLAATTWFTLSLYLQGKDLGHYAVYNYDMGSDLLKVKAPGLILSDTKDVIRPADLNAAKMRPDFILKDFSDEGDGMSVMTHPKEWAAVVGDFALQHACGARC